MAHIRISILTGSNLPNLLREADNYLALIGRHGSKFSRIGIVCCRQTVSTLIDNGENTSLSSDDNEEKEMMNEETYSEDHSRQINYHKAQQCFWLGHHERCYRCIEKMLQVEGAAHYRLTTIFYHGLNSFSLMRKGKFAKRCSQIYKAALAELLKAEELSKWNYRNKVYLLQAEKHSFAGRDEEARTSYGSAIIAARTSKFVHEQGLACECAGFHCKRMGDLEQAWRFFNQARNCYEKWGSSMKVEFVTRQMDELPDPDNTN
jgi:tetratricopeptide (TPR) repeat protein